VTRVMQTAYPMFPRLRALVRRRLERDLDDELAFRLAMRELDNGARGPAPVRRATLPAGDSAT